MIPLSLLIFLAGTRANFQLFSQHIPKFFQDLCKNGVTEFIDQQGKRLHLSGSKKFLLLPAGVFSLSVGIAAAAITCLEGTKMIAPAIIGDLPFTLVTVLAWCNNLFKSNSNSDSPRDKIYYLWKIVEFFALIINAFGQCSFGIYRLMGISQR